MHYIYVYIFLNRPKEQRRKQYLNHKKEQIKLKRILYLKRDQEILELEVTLDQQETLHVLLDGQNTFFSKGKREFFYKDLKSHQY